MSDFILENRRGAVALITLNRPEVLNAWNSAMRGQLIAALRRAEADAGVGALVLTGAGDRAFCAGQDLNEAKSFGSGQAEGWMREWELLYDLLRGLTKPLVVALNGVAAGSAFQVALLGDIRIGHPGVTMGQPEINSGIASITGPWIMREMLGLSRTTELTRTGRMMDAAEAHAIGLIARIVPQEQVLDAALTLAGDLAAKPPVAMRLDKAWLREITEPGFRHCIEAGIRFHTECYGSGEPARMMEKFLADRAARRSA